MGLRYTASSQKIRTGEYLAVVKTDYHKTIIKSFGPFSSMSRAREEAQTWIDSLEDLDREGYGEEYDESESRY